LELQSSELFSNGGSPSKVIRTWEGGQTLKACHWAQVLCSPPLN
jgi:hypothetical protein